MPTLRTLALLTATSLGAQAVTINIGNDSDGGLDATSVDNWTTNNDVYTGSNEGLAFNWENVTVNSVTTDSPNNEFDFDYQAGATTYYRWDHYNNAFKGNGDLSFNTALSNPALNATNTTWVEILSSAPDFDKNRNRANNPELQASEGSIRFGFIQWGASSATPANSQGSLSIDKFEVVLDFQENTSPIPEPSSSALFGLTGLGLLLRRRK